jgi:hypothetical protein
MRLLQALALIFAFGCAHSFHQAATDVSLNPIGQQGRAVKAEAEQFVILGMVTNTNYVEEARDALLKQCPKGTISPLTTQYLTDLGFLSWKNRIILEGTCLP